MVLAGEMNLGKGAQRGLFVCPRVLWRMSNTDSGVSISQGKKMSPGLGRGVGDLKTSARRDQTWGWKMQLKYTFFPKGRLLMSPLCFPEYFPFSEMKV